VREAADHPRLGGFLRHILFEEIVPSTNLPPGAALAFAGTVIDRFRNPWLDHEWRVIAANQTAKLRLRVVPSLTGFARKRGSRRRGWLWALRAYLPMGPLTSRRRRRSAADRAHWRTVEPNALEEPARTALSDTDLWGANLAELPGTPRGTRAGWSCCSATAWTRRSLRCPGLPEQAATGRTGS